MSRFSAWAPLPDLVDIPRYVRSRVAVRSTRYNGIMVFDCPFCGDSRGRGWVLPVTDRTSHGAAGCWNEGCVANPKMEGGFLAWAQKLEGYRMKGEAYTFLRLTFPGRTRPPKREKIKHTEVEIPFPVDPILDRRDAIKFVRDQWGVQAWKAAKAGLVVSTSNVSSMPDEHKAWLWRIIAPIFQDGKMVGFQGRTMYDHVLPKYKVEAGIPTHSLLYGLDDVEKGDAVLLVEGIGDVLRWNQDHKGGPKAVGLFGAELSSEKLALVYLKKPRSVTLALDADVPRRKVIRLGAEVKAWGIPTKLGFWENGKDAASGATLCTVPMNTLLGAVRGLLTD